MVGVEIKGLAELAANAEKIEEKLYEATVAATEQNLRVIKADAVKIAPYKTGTLRRSIAYVFTLRSPSRGLASGEVGSDLPYARILELGGNVPAEEYVHPNLFGKGIKAVMHPHYRPARPYLWPSLVKNFQGCVNRYNQAWKHALGQGSGIIPESDSSIK